MEIALTYQKRDGKTNLRFLASGRNSNMLAVIDAYNLAHVLEQEHRFLIETIFNIESGKITL
ncbi:MAG: hypothetical protein AB8I69_19145 [Anaerolineae bacterium]